MIRNYQDMERIRKPVVPTYEVARIGSRNANGATLIFPDGVTQKRYKMLEGVTAIAGDRVRVQKTNGTYIIIGII